MTAPLLVIAVGNPARGDDGLGPALLERLADEGLEGVELLLDFQLQVEHALDLVGRQAVLFVDAARADAAGPDGVMLARIAPAASFPALSHALSPAAVLQVAQRLGQPLPEAWQLAIEGASFGLGEGLSTVAQERLSDALSAARSWISARRALGASGEACGARLRVVT